MSGAPYEFGHYTIIYNVEGLGPVNVANVSLGYALGVAGADLKSSGARAALMAQIERDGACTLSGSLHRVTIRRAE